MNATSACSENLEKIKILIADNKLTISAIARANGISRKHVRNIINGKTERTAVDLKKLIESAEILAQNDSAATETILTAPSEKTTSTIENLKELSAKDRPVALKILFLLNLLKEIPDYPSFFSYMFNPELEHRINRITKILLDNSFLEINNTSLKILKSTDEINLTVNQKSYYINAAVSYFLYIAKEWEISMRILSKYGNNIDREFCIIQIVKELYEQYKLDEMYRTIVMYRHNIQQRKMRTSRALNIFFQAAFIRFYHEKRNLSSVILLGMPFLGKIKIHTSSQSKRFSGNFDLAAFLKYDERFGHDLHDVTTYIKKAIHSIISAYVLIDQFSLAKELTDFCLNHFSCSDPDYPDFYLFYFLIYRNYGSKTDITDLTADIRKKCGQACSGSLSFQIYELYRLCLEGKPEGADAIFKSIVNICRGRPNLLSRTVFIGVYIQFMLLTKQTDKALILLLNWIIRSPKSYQYHTVIYSEILMLLTVNNEKFLNRKLSKIDNIMDSDPFFEILELSGGTEFQKKLYLFLCSLKGANLPELSRLSSMKIGELLDLLMKKSYSFARMCRQQIEDTGRQGIPRMPSERRNDLSDKKKDWFIYDLYLSEHINKPYRLRSIPTSLSDLKPYLYEFDLIPVFHFLGMHTFLENYKNAENKVDLIHDFRKKLKIEKARILGRKAGRVETPATEKGDFHLFDIDLKKSFLSHHLLNLLEQAVIE